MRFFITFSVRVKRKNFIDIAVFCFVLMATDDDDGRVTLFFHSRCMAHIMSIKVNESMEMTMSPWIRMIFFFFYYLRLVSGVQCPLKAFCVVCIPDASQTHRNHHPSIWRWRWRIERTMLFLHPPTKSTGNVSVSLFMELGQAVAICHSQ